MEFRICESCRFVLREGGAPIFPMSRGAENLNRALQVTRAMWHRWEISRWTRRWARSPRAGHSISRKSKLYSTASRRTKINDWARTSPTSTRRTKNHTPVLSNLWLTMLEILICHGRKMCFIHVPSRQLCHTLISTI